MKLNVSARVADLVSRLTLTEKLGMLGPDINGTCSSFPNFLCLLIMTIDVDTCNCLTQGVPRLGIPNYMQIVEVNSAVASTCWGTNKCATVFP